jgi:hypothetical protein
VAGAAGIPSTCTTSTMSMAPSSPGASPPSSSSSSSSSDPAYSDTVDMASLLQNVCEEADNDTGKMCHPSRSPSDPHPPSQTTRAHGFSSSVAFPPSPFGAFYAACATSPAHPGLRAFAVAGLVPSPSPSPRGLYLNPISLQAPGGGAGQEWEDGREGGKTDDSDAFFASPSPR